MHRQVSQLQRLSVKVMAYQCQSLPEPGPVPWGRGYFPSRLSALPPVPQPLLRSRRADCVRSEALRCKGSGIYANCGQLCLPFPGWAVFALGTDFMLREVWGDKARLFEDRSHPWEANNLAVLRKEWAAVLVKFGNFLITKERPYDAEARSVQFGHHRTGMRW